MKRLLKTPVVDSVNILMFISTSIYASKILAGKSSKDLMKELVRVKSSNVWGYAIDAGDGKSRTGNVIVQFKGTNGGPGDVYMYYDVPIQLYRKWHSAPSKGHFFWRYIRNNFKYSKLTGDKRGKLANAVNSR